jgi:hypothetical protein
MEQTGSNVLQNDLLQKLQLSLYWFSFSATASTKQAVRGSQRLQNHKQTYHGPGRRGGAARLVSTHCAALSTIFRSAEACYAVSNLAITSATPCSEEEEVQDQDAGAAAKAGQEKKGYVGIHATGFKELMLKPELLQAITDCGFEHPSEGKQQLLVCWVHGKEIGDVIWCLI